MLESDRTKQLAVGSDDAIDAAVDAIRDRYGTDSIMRAVLLGRDRGIEMPLLPD
jgi:DNA polymerase-4